MRNGQMPPCGRRPPELPFAPRPLIPLTHAAPRHEPPAHRLMLAKVVYRYDNTAAKHHFESHWRFSQTQTSDEVLPQFYRPFHVASASRHKETQVDGSTFCGIVAHPSKTAAKPNGPLKRDREQAVERCRCGQARPPPPATTAKHATKPTPGAARVGLSSISRIALQHTEKRCERYSA